MKFKFIYKIFVIHAKFLVLLNLLREPDITCSGAGSGRGPCIPGLHVCATIDPSHLLLENY